MIGGARIGAPKVAPRVQHWARRQTKAREAGKESSTNDNQRVTMKRTGPTNPELQGLIAELRKRGIEQGAFLWQRVASDLERSTRQRRVVNLSRISRFSEENDVVVIPGKVLGAGSLGHKVTVSAFQFSSGAKEKIEQAGGVVIPLLDLSKSAPKGKAIKIIG